MQAKDLRIDNWFYAVHPVDGLFEMQVRGIAQDGTIETDAYGNTYGTIDCYGDSCKPIPLTEEWLIKFGFEKINHKMSMNDGSYNCHWERHFDDFKTGSCIYFSGGFFSNNRFNKRHLYHKNKYVHQLQNLYFALTGEELEIK